GFLGSTGFFDFYQVLRFYSVLGFSVVPDSGVLPGSVPSLVSERSTGFSGRARGIGTPNPVEPAQPNPAQPGRTEPSRTKNRTLWNPVEPRRTQQNPIFIQDV